MPSRFLIVEDDRLLGPAFAALVGRGPKREARLARTLGEARGALCERPFTGLVLDVQLPDGSGLDLLAQLRARGDRTPALVVTGLYDRAIANRAHELGAGCVSKPSVRANLELFVEESTVLAAEGGARLDAAVAILARRHELTPREAEVAHLVALGLPRGGLAAALGISENTLKHHVRAVLAKCGAPRLEALVRLVIAELLAAEQGPSA